METTAALRPAGGRIVPADSYPFVLIHGTCMGSFSYFIFEEAERLAAIGAPWTAWAHRYPQWDASRQMQTEHCFDLALPYGTSSGISIGTSRQTAERYIRLALDRPQLSRRHGDIRALAETLGIVL